jgi:hypothetical protein
VSCSCSIFPEKFANTLLQLLERKISSVVLRSPDPSRLAVLTIVPNFTPILFRVGGFPEDGLDCLTDLAGLTFREYDCCVKGRSRHASDGSAFEGSGGRQQWHRHDHAWTCGETGGTAAESAQDSARGHSENGEGSRRRTIIVWRARRQTKRIGI